MIPRRISRISSLLIAFALPAPVLAQTPPAAPPAGTPPAAEPAPSTAPATPSGVTTPPVVAEPTPAPAPAESSALAPPDPAPPGPPPVESATLAEEPAPPKPAGPPQLKLETEDGTSIRFGILWQGQYEARGNPANPALQHNLFVRRFAVLLGGTVLKDFEYFFDTDFADLLKAPGPDGVKNGPAIQTKDAFATWRAVDDRLKIDGGLLLPPGAHNSLQGGASNYALDFFSNTFRHSTVFASAANPYGRDLGFQLRGIVGLLEYRAGVFQGRRNVATATRPGSRNPFRYAARVQLNFRDPETAFFYSGTYLGKKQIFSVGASADFQPDEDGSYRTFTGDVFVDLPVANDGVTAQVNLVHRNGGDRVVLPKQTALAAEAGYRFDVAKLSPIVRFEKRWGATEIGDETNLGFGLSYWAYGHTSNLKAFYTRTIPDAPADPYHQFNLQWQLAFY